MIEERDYSWSAVDADEQRELVLEHLRSAVFGDIPAYVLTESGRRAKGSDIGRIKDQLAAAMAEPDGYNMTGYSVVFGESALIRGEGDDFYETVSPGATAKSIKERGDRILVMWEHGRSPIYGTMPVAAPRAIWEDSRGLFAWDRFHKAPLFEPLRENIRTGAIRGQSYRFTVPEGGDVWSAPRSGPRRRQLTQVDIIERGPVTFPAFAGTSVSVRSVDEQVGDIVRGFPADLRAAMLRALESPVDAATIPAIGTESSAALVSTEGPAATMSEPAPGVTRRDLQRLALPILVGVTHVETSGDPQGPARRP